MTETLERLRAALADRYRIENEIGAGGMATVYLAHDLRHHRRVAVKVLRQELAATLGPDRFLNEIRIAANLTHPHILPVHDSGEADGFLYYVMPYVAGESLREMLSRQGELPIADAARLLRDIVDALSHAHAQGVVHRDIKPDNILHSGRHALVMDFGVAKAVSEATGRHTLTTAGVALGTPHYMAPEQASAEPQIDHRADIYAVGAMAYELLTGRPPFSGTTSQQILAAHVLEAPAPVTARRTSVPPAFAEIVMKCLEKKAADRWQRAEDLIPLFEALATPSGGMTPTQTAPTQAKGLDSRIVSVGSAVAIVLLILAWLFFWPSSQSPRVVVGQASQVTRALGLELDPALSPDGRTVAYASGPIGQMHIYIRQLAGGGSIGLTEGHPGDHRVPHWSPDASQILYQADGSIYTVPTFGGTPRRVADPSMVSSFTGFKTGYLDNPTWSPDGTQVAFVWQGSHPDLSNQGRGTIIFAMEVSGARLRKLADVVEAHSLRWSPDGTKLAYVSGASLFVFGHGALGNVDPSSIEILSVDGGEHVVVSPHEFLNLSPVWTATGEDLLFISDRGGSRDIYQVSLDGSGRPRGEPARVTTGLNAHSIDLSADGAHLAYSVFSHIANIWSLDIPSDQVSISRARPITNESQVVEALHVSADGPWIAYDSNREGNQDIYKIPRDGGDPQRLTSDPSDDYVPAWSPDGTELAFYSLRTGNRDIYVMGSDGGQPRQITNDPAQDRGPSWSPAGNALVFSSDRTGRPELYIVRREQAGGEWGAAEPLTTDGGFWPKWSRVRDEILFYSDPLGAIQAISPSGGAARTLARGQDLGLALNFAAWSRDGSTVFFSGYSPDETLSVWAVPATAGRARQVVVFDDPTKRFTRGEFALDDTRIYFSIQQFEGDVWVMELVSNP